MTRVSRSKLKVNSIEDIRKKYKFSVINDPQYLTYYDYFIKKCKVQGYWIGLCECRIENEKEQGYLSQYM